jgi:hypothetical protein
MRLSKLTLRLREKIEPKLIYSPFLRLIIFSPWFLLGFCAVLVTLIGGALYLPKIWRVSPSGFEPIIRISGLDMTQNWSLKRSARKLEAEGRIKEAVEAWQGAVAQNPADLTALRGALDSCARLKQLESRFLQAAISQMQWLLRINNTNSTDVDLVARTSDRLGIYDYAAYILSPLEKQKLPAAAQAVLIKSFFHQNRIPEFVEGMEQQTARVNDPELRYYKLAFTAGWKSDPESAGAFTELKNAVESTEYSERIGHLLLRAAAQKRQIEIFSHELDRLARRNEARADDHALYWALLAATGKTNEAVTLARSATLKPVTAMQLVHVAQSYLTLGLIDNAHELLREMAPYYARTPEIWMLYMSVLQTKQDWNGVRRAARIIRQDLGLRETLWGYSYYLDGRADLADKRQAAAKVSFEKAAASTYDYPMVGAVVAKDLAAAGFPELALRVYNVVAKDFSNNIAFWDGYYNAAVAAQDAAELLKATENSHRLVPKDAARLNNYAAALLVNQARPAEAIQLTLQFHSKFPQSNTAIINHSCALLLNHRSEEARSLLEKVNVRTLGPIESSQYYLTLFETYHSLKMWEPAQKARELITDSALYPVQRDRLREKEKQLPNLAKAV